MKAAQEETTQTALCQTGRNLITPLLRWYRKRARPLPWRKTRDPYAIWISEIMLQQTQVKTVVPYWERWMAVFPDIHSLAKAPEHQVLKMWEGLGYYCRARNLRQTAQLLTEQHQGQFPVVHAQILSLPGVGPYTAGAICSMAFNQPTAVLDGNVRRVLARIFAVPERTRSAASQKRFWMLARHLMRAVASRRRPAERRFGDWNQALMELGAMVCTARKPVCPKCPVKNFCEAKRRELVERYPAPQLGLQQVSRICWVFAIEHRGKWLVRRRPFNIVNGGLWEFPNVEVNQPHPDPDAWVLSALGFTPAWIGPLMTFAHSITRNRFHLTVFRGAVVTPPPLLAPDEHWQSLAQAERLPFTGAHRKILARLIDEQTTG
jgi:A/G-specific adenine glycosylase